MANKRLVAMLRSENGVVKFNAWRDEHPAAKPNLDLADLHGLDLTEANFRGLRLAGANLSGARLVDADLYEADLSAADLRGANLVFAEIANADLRHTNLLGTRLGKTRGVGYALFSGARMDNRTAHKVLIRLERTFVGIKRL